MMSLALTLGRWNLSFELGRAADPEEGATSVTLSDGSEIADGSESCPEVVFGFHHWGSEGIMEAIR